MSILSELYYITKYKFRNHDVENELEAQGFADYMDELQKERQQLHRENKNLKENVSYLTREVDRQEKEIFTQYDKITDLEEEILTLYEEKKEKLPKNYKDEYRKTLKQVIKLQNDRESSLYMEGMMQDALEKTTDQKNTYKEVINKMCDKFGIERKEVVNIIDDIKAEKDNNIQREI